MNQFVQTSVSQRIHAAIDLAIEMDVNASIIGAPGVGKTMALEAYRSDDVQIARLTVTPILAGSMRELVREVLLKLDMHTWATESIYEMQRALNRQYLGCHLLIIDEAQNLPLKSFRQLLAFSPTDGGLLKIIFCGNEDMLKQVNTDLGALAQISRRVKVREHIEFIYDDDADAIGGLFGVEGLDAYKVLRTVAQRFHADGVAQVLMMASRIAHPESIKLRHVQQALSTLPQFRSALQGNTKRRKAD